MFSLIRKLLVRKGSKFMLNPQADTVPEALFISLSTWEALYLGLFISLRSEDKLASLASYLMSPQFLTTKLSKDDPNHAFLIGYAMCAAFYEQKEIQRRAEASKVLELFDIKKETKKEVN